MSSRKRNSSKISPNHADTSTLSLSLSLSGVLFIDEVHMLDIECFTYLNR